MFSGNPKEKPVKPIRTVPKVQYDQLLTKYEQILRNNNKKTELRPNSKDVSPDLVETVDVFNEKGSRKSNMEMNAEKLEFPKVSDKNENVGDIQDQITKYQNAKKMILKKDYDSGMLVLKELENSSIKQIRVRARYSIGNLLYLQGEYDLALQKFEQIINKDAFSGVVLKALRGLINCSDKLNLKKKKERYHSILYDFFES